MKNKTNKVVVNIIRIVALVALVVIAILLVLVIDTFNRSQEVKITNAKDIYAPNEEVIVSGLAKQNSEIVLYFDNKLGLIQSDSHGKWTANLGKLSEGRHGLEVSSNTSSNEKSVASVFFIVSNDARKVSLFNRMSEFLTAGLTAVSQKDTKEVTTIPVESPQVLQGQWDLVK